MTNRTIFKSVRSGLMATVCCLALAGCESYLNPPTQMTQNEIRVNQAQRSVDLDAAKVTQQQVRDVADDYMDNGAGEMVVRVTYDRGGNDQQAEIALKRVSKISKMLRAEGVKNARVVIMPADVAHGRALVSYQVLEALPAEGCDVAPGMNGAAGGADVKKYDLGCETRTYMSEQIARPRDLLGNAPDEGFDSQRESIIYNGMYRSGQPMESLGGESASGTASQ